MEMKHKILVVDDEQNIREIIKDLLQLQGYEVTVAVDGSDALDKMKYEEFDLYILDVYMPRLNGLELMKKIKEQYPLAVIIITTGYSSIKGALNAIRSGAFHYITKPINGEELFSVVEKGMKHFMDLTDNVEKPIPEVDIKTTNLFSGVLLRGFSEEDKQEFEELAVRKEYLANAAIEHTNEDGGIIFVESGEVSVFMGDILVEKLNAGKSWGEETFIPSNTIFTRLVTDTDSIIKHYSRKRIIEYFNYKGESLMKRFMINLLNVMYVKWKRSLGKIGTFMGYTPNQKKE
jgi:CheY-like chemotaxis protein